MSAISSPAADRLRSRIAGLLKVEEDRKLEVYQTLFQSAGVADLQYWLELFLAAGLATLGLVQNSVAVIIGAMLLSPAMGPILAAVSRSPSATSTWASRRCSMSLRASWRPCSSPPAS